MATTFRVGIGYDIHRLAEGRRLVLGGVEIDYPLGLLGHSDGDVVLHAVTDALLGAAGLPDIGDLFPDTDPAYKDIDSRELLATAIEKVAEAGYAPNNIDLIVHAEKPKLSEHKGAMASSIALLTGLGTSAVSVKAKTNEGLGPLGHADGIACTATVSIVNKPKP
ncbi:MAG TPA: 2-C-methyl-D-erythritol 2,4-cyclodiphosphate synthase [Phycisphaerae bacterium]|nr:2-C-methyl-D-erythritol 2,4-cyclodiphosphate synthase [Phycisphaerae bacterium]